MMTSTLCHGSVHLERDGTEGWKVIYHFFYFFLFVLFFPRNWLERFAPCFNVWHILATRKWYWVIFVRLSGYFWSIWNWDYKKISRLMALKYLCSHCLICLCMERMKIIAHGIIIFGTKKEQGRRHRNLQIFPFFKNYFCEVTGLSP